MSDVADEIVLAGADALHKFGAHEIGTLNAGYLSQARAVIAAVAPLIEQRVIERLQKLAPSFQKVGDTSEWADGYRAGARDALDAAAMVIKDMNEESGRD